ncbi:uncharacterized protein [Solanum lycopersicum]|uniref:Uncharacterized protein LOC107017574 n=1 Tax=Solanum pennellii TaxID=28526 RepID=A0ABM1V8F5_SOLPN|nr:uncharacterized protein LOC104647208 isoform X1 [Solanum lycopersicum]XP_027772023.1 uncharacterized protein LOC107017574 [Solanum pennellii]
MAFRFGGRQMAGRALLGASTQLRGYCQKISPTESSRSEKDVRACIAGGLVAFLFYSYWLRNEAWKIKERSTLLTTTPHSQSFVIRKGRKVDHHVWCHQEEQKLFPTGCEKLLKLFNKHQFSGITVVCTMSTHYEDGDHQKILKKKTVLLSVLSGSL